MGFASSAGLLNGPGRADGIALHLPRSLRIVVPVPVLAVLLWGHGAQAQPITYSVNGVLTSVPSCVSRVFSVGDRWTINVVIEERDPDLDQENSPTQDTEDGQELAEPDDGEAPPSDEDAVVAPPTDEDAEEGTGADRLDALDVDALEPEESTTVTHAASTFWWTVGDVSGSATGVTRVFVSNDSRDSVGWQALSYSATFSPSSLDETGILGIQAGLVDSSGSVFDSTELPKVERSQFDDGFFQVFFKTKCEPFGHDSLDGSVVSVGPVVPYLP